MQEASDSICTARRVSPRILRPVTGLYHGNHSALIIRFFLIIELFITSVIIYDKKSAIGITDKY